MKISWSILKSRPLSKKFWDFYRLLAYNFISGHMKMIMAVLRSVVDLGITNMSPQLSMYSLYHISTSGIRGWPITRASREGMRACGVGQSDTARLELIWSSADYGVDTGLVFELSLHGDKTRCTSPSLVTRCRLL